MIRELYLYKAGGAKTLIDIDKVDIVRTYTSPYFSDVEQLKTDGTLSVTLPDTDINNAFFEYCNRLDMNSQIPYSYIYADYYIDGLTIFLNAECKVLSTFKNYEVQFVYGVNRAKYLPLFEKKLNEIVVGTGITADDWIINWNKNYMYATGKKYQYIDYISGERESDVLTVGNTIYPRAIPSEPIRSAMKPMTQHPFITFKNILDLISTENNIETFTDLKLFCGNKGIILGGTKVNNLNFQQGSFTTTADTFPTISLSSIVGGNTIPFITSGHQLRFDQLSFGEHLPLKIRVTADFRIDSYYGVSIDKYVNGVMTNAGSFGNNGISSGYYNYTNSVDLEVNADETDCYFEFTFGGANAVVFDPAYTNKINIITQSINSGYYSINSNGIYDVLANLPNISQMEFINNILINTCTFLGYNTDGNLRVYSFDELLSNLNSGDVYDWSDKISNIRKSYHQFNSNAKKNYIKFNNDKDLTDRKATLTVTDDTLNTERDLYTLDFESPLGNLGDISEYINYKQDVTRESETSAVLFKNKYTKTDGVAFVDTDLVSAINIMPNHTLIPYTKYVLANTAPADNQLSCVIEDVADIKIGDYLTLIIGELNEVIVEDVRILDLNKTTGLITFSKSIVPFYSEGGLPFMIQILEYVFSGYVTYQKIIQQPTVIEGDINLGFFESANIDYAKPIYAKEIGKYCILLEMQAPDNEVCTAKLLLINQTL